MKLQRLSISLIAASLVSTLLLALSPLGGYVDEHLFLNPIFNLAAKLKLQPSLSHEVRIILMDDSSLKLLGRQPTFSEWARIAKLLEAEGFGRSLLQEPMDLETMGGDLTKTPDAEIYVGIVNVPPSQSSRLIAAKEIPAHLSLEGSGARQHDFTKTVATLAPARALFPFIKAIGSNDFLGDGSAHVTLGLIDERSRVYPSLGLYAHPDLRLEGGQLMLGNDAVPLSDDGGTYVDFVSMASVLAQALPAKAFFKGEGETAHVVDALSPALRKRLAGGKVALLLPGAYTGSRFLKTPVEGLVPAYLSLASIANSALTGRFIYKPLAHAVVLALLAPLFTLILLRIRRTPVALTTTLVLWGGATVFMSVSFFVFGWYLPAASLTFALIPPFAIRLAEYVRGTIAEKGKLQSELSLGQTVQNLLLPQKRQQTFGPWEIDLTYKPFGAMAGDWYQIWSNDEGCAVLAIGDVVGKGASAALVTAAVAAVWHGETLAWGKGQIDGQRLIEVIDQAIRQAFRQEQNSALLLAILTPTTANLFCAAAPRWIYAPVHGTAANVVTKAMNPLGMEDVCGEARFKEIIPKAGDAFMAFTDGVLDVALQRRDFLSELTKQNAVADLPSLASISALALAKSANAAIPDDQTILTIRFHADASAARKAG